jgi:predicted ribosomally synthesized peptide with nif11-like leader
MSREGLDALRARVSADPDLARRLHRLEPERFTSEVIREAAELGFDVAEPDLDAAIAQARSAWMLRWVR